MNIWVCIGIVYLFNLNIKLYFIRIYLLSLCEKIFFKGYLIFVIFLFVDFSF